MHIYQIEEPKNMKRKTLHNILKEATFFSVFSFFFVIGNAKFFDISRPEIRRYSANWEPRISINGFECELLRAIFRIREFFFCSIRKNMHFSRSLVSAHTQYKIFVEYPKHIINPSNGFNTPTSLLLLPQFCRWLPFRFNGAWFLFFDISKRIKKIKQQRTNNRNGKGSSNSNTEKCIELMRGIIWMRNSLWMYKCV